MRDSHFHRTLETAMSVALTVTCLLVVFGCALPMDPRAGRKVDPNVAGGGPFKPPPLPDTPGLDPEEYNRYWQEMARGDPVLQEHLQRLKPEELAKLHPRVSERMARESDEIRNRLEEARRMNMDELRELQRMQMLRDRRMNPESEWVAKQQALRENLPPNYDHQDLQRRLEEQRRMLEEIDRKRRDDFQRHEMQMEHNRREKLRAMEEQERLKAEQEFRQRREQQLHHERLNQPASKQQLEEVWEKDDGLKGEEFDPKTFFFIHDTNGDRNLDPMELEALFYNEVKKAYGKNADTMQSHEEMARMREFAMKQLDRNRDSIISLEEFLGYAAGEHFDENEEWKPVVDKEEELFSEEDLQKYEDYEDYYDYEYDEHGNIIGFKTKPTASPGSVPPPPGHDSPAPPQGNGVTGDTGAAQSQSPPAGEGANQQNQPGQSDQSDQSDQQDGGVDMPEHEQQLHIQATGTQKDGQGQQILKQPDVKQEGAPGNQL